MRIGSLIGKGAAAVAVIVVTLFICAAIDMGLFYGPWPWQSPREQDRVVHPSGFSIIKPQGWKERISVRHDPVPECDSINLQPNSKARITPFYSVRQLATAPNIERMKNDGGYTIVKFQGRDALGHEAVSGKYWIVERFLERKSRWYSITLLLPDEEGSEITVPVLWWSYLESFKTNE
jgi:hypothetical protein